MIRYMVSLALVAGLAGCATPEKPAQVSAKEQVDNLAQMCADNAGAMRKRQEEQTLYSRLGEREGIEKLITRLHAQHLKNKQIAHFFKDILEEAFINNVTDFLAANAGGGGEYNGRTMDEVHKNLGITHADFLSAGGDVQNVMKELGYGENEIQESVCFLVSFVPAVVTN